MQRVNGMSDRDDKVLALRCHWVKSMEYHGPLSPEQRKRYVVLRRFFWRRLGDEAVRRWGIARLEADIVAEAAITSLAGVLRHLSKLTTLEDIVEGEIG